VRKILKNPKLVSNSPWAFIAIVWLFTRFFHFQNFELVLATDSSDYLRAAQELNLSNQNDPNLSRSFLYVVILRFFSQNISALVYMQIFLTLFSAFLMLRILLARKASKRIATAVVILYLVFPMTAHFEGQILTENLSLFLLLVFFTFWEDSIKLRSSKSLSFAILIAVSLVLHRPNYIVFVTIIVIVSWLQKRKSLFGVKRLMIIPICFSTLIGLNFVTSGTLQVGGNLLRTGIAMHLVDTFATDRQNSAMSREIDLSENTIKAENPSNRYWAVQDGSKEFLRSKNLSWDVDEVLWERTKILLKEYPLLFAQSVNNSFFSVLVTDSGAFRPTGGFRDLPNKVSNILGLLVLGPTVFFGLWLYLFYLLAFFGRGNKNQSREDLPYVIAILGVSVLNAIVSPIEQGRYIFPFLPIVLILGTRFLSTLYKPIRSAGIPYES
jgi:hypothetical protein